MDEVSVTLSLNCLSVGPKVRILGFLVSLMPTQENGL